MTTRDTIAGSAESGIKIFLQNWTVLPLRGLVKTYRAYKNRRTIASMRDFDDAQLADIGLSRRDIDKALDLAFRDNPYASLIQARERTARGLRRF
ncbi:uncharacterized protein YjiS (DUF1127 family) [Rhizobium sp. SG_E_25_P2]|uniref:DUF1127 domain-containing protein n=1 Tax=Rhizobium sp. SG_E_25_P2 TaxID=2879942 RepID=UPI0024757D16|nr:DUF1127 domain-containing protein [Rhizobium sp. SG_E_25_P2]MDH6264907.1 uncharacterized protein YjiS (DUF1127 family) [Rhizobium sp. SG_E_25_P2]